jgi:excisionase family DNA binding protein
LNPHLDFLLSVLYDHDALAAEHLADLRASGLREATIAEQKFRTVPPSMIDQLLGFPAPRVTSAYILPGAGNTWTQQRVISLRHAHDIPVFSVAPEGAATLTIEEAARLLGVSTTTVGRLTSRDTCPRPRPCPTRRGRSRRNNFAPRPFSEQLQR